MPNESQHYLKIMEAAAPYLSSAMQKQIHLMLQANELLESMNAAPSEFSALEADGARPDMEHMLEHILPICNNNEQAMVHRILNTIRAGRMLRTYQSFQQSQTGGSQGSSQFQDFLMTQLTPDQQETLKTFQAILSN